MKLPAKVGVGRKFAPRAKVRVFRLPVEFQKKINLLTNFKNVVNCFQKLCTLKQINKW